MTKIYAKIKVVVEHEYTVPLANIATTVEDMGWDAVTELDARTVRECVDEWFVNYRLDAYHATRDAHLVGGSSIFLGARLGGEIKVKT